MAQLTIHSPLGDLTLSEQDDAIVSLDWGRAPPEFQNPTKLLRHAANHLNRYFDGIDIDIDFPLAPPGTEFRRQVWSKMRDIPFGSTRTYGQMAADLNSSPRAVGGACRANPIPILIPCHRVVAADGQLGGFSADGGIPSKIFLLRLEGALL